MPQFPSMKARQLLAVLEAAPLCYETIRQSGSHRIMASDDFPRLLFSFHDNQTIPPGLVRKILTKDVALSEEEALRLL